jgi:hypothetical protein
MLVGLCRGRRPGRAAVLVLRAAADGAAIVRPLFPRLRGHGRWPQPGSGAGRGCGLCGGAWFGDGLCGGPGLVIGVRAGTWVCADALPFIAVIMHRVRDVAGAGGRLGRGGRVGRVTRVRAGDMGVFSMIRVDCP